MRLYDSDLSKRAHKSAGIWRLGLVLSFFLISLPAQSLTLEELREDADLTPERLLRYFSDFKFKLGEQVQASDAFLSSKAGDCDDFATLAATVLREKGYTPRLIVVFMERQVHVVCYIVETKSYLDYNNRKLSSPSVPSDGTLADIAQKVARAFHAAWTCASEFAYKNGIRQTLWTDFPQMGDTQKRQSRRSIRPSNHETVQLSSQP